MAFYTICDSVPFDYGLYLLAANQGMAKFMTMPKYGAATDLNQQEIVDALRKIGCTVLVIGRPLDLLVGHRKRNFLLEVKQANVSPSQKKKTDAQREFFKTWEGQARIVETAEEAIRVVTNSYGG